MLDKTQKSNGKKYKPALSLFLLLDAFNRCYSPGQAVDFSQVSKSISKRDSNFHVNRLTTNKGTSFSSFQDWAIFLARNKILKLSLCYSNSADDAKFECELTPKGKEMLQSLESKISDNFQHKKSWKITATSWNKKKRSELEDSNKQPVLPRYSFQIQEMRGEPDSLIIKAFLSSNKSEIHKLFWVFASAYFIKLNNVTNHQIVLNLALQPDVTLVRWVNIFKSDEPVTKNHQLQNRGQTIPGIGVCVLVTRHVELSDKQLTVHRSFPIPFRKKLAFDLTGDEQARINNCKRDFDNNKAKILSSIKSTSCNAINLKNKEILSLFKRINFKPEDLNFFIGKQVLLNWLSVTNVPSKPVLDFPFHAMPVSIPLGRSSRDKRYSVGFPELQNRIVLISGGHKDTRLALALKSASHLKNKVIIIDLLSNGSEFEPIFGSYFHKISPGNPNISIFSLTPPPGINTAAINAYKSNCMASILIHSSQIDEYYRARDHVQAVLGSAYNNAGTNTIACTKIIDEIENATSQLRSNSPREDQVLMLVNSFADFIEINSPKPVSIQDLLDTKTHVWLHFNYQPMRIRIATVLWFLHEAVMNQVENCSFIIKNIEELANNTRNPEKNRLIVHELLPLLGQLAIRNHVFLTCNMIERLHHDAFLSVRNSIHLKISSDDAWRLIKSKYGFKIESEQFEALKKLTDQGFLVREDRQEIPFIMDIDLSENELYSISSKLKASKVKNIFPSSKIARNGQFTSRSRELQDSKEFFFNRIGVEDSQIELPDDPVVARSCLEICHLLVINKTASETDIKKLIAGMKTDMEQLNLPENRKFVEIDETVKILAKSGYFSTQYIERAKHSVWALKAQGDAFYRRHVENYRHLLTNIDNFSIPSAINEISQYLYLHEGDHDSNPLINSMDNRSEIFHILRQVISLDYEENRKESWKIYTFIYWTSKNLMRVAEHQELNVAISILHDCLSFLQHLQLVSRNSKPQEKTLSKLHSDISGEETVSLPVNIGKLSESTENVDFKSRTELEFLGNDNGTAAGIGKDNPVERSGSDYRYDQDIFQESPDGWPFNVNTSPEMENIIQVLGEVSEKCNREKYPVTSLLVIKSHLDKEPSLSSYREKYAEVSDYLFDHYRKGVNSS
ncbi:MAG: hypothetical protein ACFFD4_33275 [Candidatus Odinarchaeota archaeon]